MRVFYGLIITAVILMIGACALKAYKKEGALARVVFLYELGAFICGIIIFSIYMCSRNYHYSVVQGTYYGEL